MSSVDEYTPSGETHPWRVRYAELLGWEHGEELWLCDPPSWRMKEPDYVVGSDYSIKCGHRNESNGNWAPTGEVPGHGFIMQAVEVSYEQERLTTEQVVGHIHRLLDLIVERDATG